MKKLLTLILALAMIFPLVAFGGNSDALADEPVVVRAGTTDVLGSFLMGATVGSNHRGLTLVFDLLFDYDENGDAYSRVLEDWYYEDDCTIILKLKDGITFSDGSKLTGEDVLFSLDVYRQMGSAIQDLFNAFNPETSEVSEDGLTVTLRTDEPYGPGLYGCNEIPLYCKAWADEVGLDNDTWVSAPMGSGPYEVAEFVTDSYVRVVKRDDYWDKDFDYSFDELILYHYPEGSTMFIDLETGKLDIALNINTADYERAEAGIENIAIDSIPAKDPVMFCMDVDDNEFLSNEKLREAIAYGVNWEEVKEAGKGDVSEICTSVITKFSPYHVDIGTYEYDPDRAKAAMEESGYAGQTITLNMVSNNDAIKDEMFAIIEYYFRQLGIEYRFLDFDFGTTIGYWLGLADEPTDTMFQDSDVGSIIGEPFASLRFLMLSRGPFPVCTISDEHWNELAEAAFAAVDSEERAAYYAELQQYTYDHYLVIPIYENADPIAWRTDRIASTGITNIACGLRDVKVVG